MWIMNLLCFEIFLYVSVFVLSAVVLFLFVKILEYFYCVYVRKQVPFVPSTKQLRKRVVCELKENYPNTKNVVEIGSGFGGLARYVARKTKMQVLGIENMPFCAIVSRCCDWFCPRVRTVYADAFDYLDKFDGKFDVAIAYLGIDWVPKLMKYRKKIKVLILLDFEIVDVVPTRVIDLKSGYTRYGGKKYPHKLFVYEFK